MAHAFYHAKSSARRFGGVLEDYIELHRWLDSTKAHLADARHRLVLHNTWGIFLAEQIFGVAITEPSQKAPFFRYGDEWLFLLERGNGPRRRVRSTEIPLLACNLFDCIMIA